MAKNSVKPSVSAPGITQKQAAKSIPGGGLSLRLKLALLIALVSFIAYANTLKNRFAVDDAVMLTHNTIVTRGIAAIPELLVTPHQKGFKTIANDEYRPLSLVLMAVEYQLWGLEPMPYHLVNILLFAGCVILLFLFFDELLSGKKIAVAFITALLFTLHPIHTEVVANVKSCDELLAFLLAFLGMRFFIRYNRSGNKLQLAVGTVCFFLSLLSKESAVTFLGIIPLVFFFFLNEHKNRGAYIFAGVALATITFIALRTAVLSHYHINTLQQISFIENMLADKSLSTTTRIATAIMIMGRYIKLLFIPYPLVCDYSFSSIPYVTFGDPMALLSLAAYIALAVYCVLRFTKDRRDPYAFGIAFFLITISLFTNIFFMIKSTMGERFLFYPSAGFCFIIALLLHKWVAGSAAGEEQVLRHPKVLGTILVLSIAYLFITVDRNSEWVDNSTLYKADVEKNPRDARLLYFWGYDLFRQYNEAANPAEKESLLNESIVFYRRSLAVYPLYEYALADLGAAYFCNRQFDSAEAYDNRVLTLHPDDVTTRNNLSGALLNEKKYPEEIAHCKKTIQLIPGNVYAYADLGLVFFQTGKYDSAIHYLKRGIDTDPKFFGCYDVLSSVYNAIGNKDSAAIYRSMAQSHYNNN